MLYISENQNKHTPRVLGENQTAPLPKKSSGWVVVPP